MLKKRAFNYSYIAQLYMRNLLPVLQKLSSKRFGHWGIYNSTWILIPKMQSIQKKVL